MELLTSGQDRRWQLRCFRWGASVEESTIDIAPFLSGRDDLVFRNEDQVVRSRPILEQVLECLADHRLAVRAADFSKILKLI